MKNKRKLLSMLLILFMLLSSIPKSVSMASVDMEQNTQTFSLDAETNGYPSSVDWSTSEYLAPVGNQGASGSCWHYGTIYASMNFSNNKERREKATDATIINPIFGYNYAMRTTKVQMDLVHAIGYPSVDVLPIDTKELKSLFPYKEVWESALLNRGGEMISVKNYGEEDSIITGPKDASLNLMKEVLCSGKVIAVGALSYNWNTSVVADGEHKGEYAIDRCDLNKTGGHIMAIVGYDDDIWIDINYDGKKQEAELGAIKIMNSWGSGWANDGFAWVAYDALNKVSQVLTQEDVNRINAAIDQGTIKCNKVNNKVRKSFFMFDVWSYPTSVREKRTSNCLIYFTVNTGSRREMTMSITATEKKTGEQASFILPDLSVEKENLALDGTAAATDGTLVLDLDNVIPDLSPDTMENYDWEVTFEDNAKDTYSLTVKDLYFTVDGAKKYLATVSNLPLNGEKRTYKVHKRTAEGTKDTVIEQENSSNVIVYYNNTNYKDISENIGRLRRQRKITQEQLRNQIIEKRGRLI